MAVIRSFSILIFGALLLGGCGNRTDLQPRAGQPLPIKPLMARATPTPAELLTPPAYADPDRVDELMKSSSPRMPDRFDLPPPDGGAPRIPIQATDDEVNDTGPVEQ